VVFLVAFFFMVLFSLGLDLGAALPGFFFTAIRIPPLGSLLPDELQNEFICRLECSHYRNLLSGDQAPRT
jgi:hypothetical protein